MCISMCISMWINGIISKIPHRNSKILFVLGSYEDLERLEGKSRKYLFFYVKIFWNNKSYINKTKKQKKLNNQFYSNKDLTSPFHASLLKGDRRWSAEDRKPYTQYVLISKGPISKTSQISGFFKQWLVKFSKLSNNLFCSRFLSNPLVIFFNSTISKLLLLHSNLLPSVFLSGYAQNFVSKITGESKFFFFFYLIKQFFPEN